jgi:hypothetical protein
VLRRSGLARFPSNALSSLGQALNRLNTIVKDLVGDHEISCPVINYQ